MDNEKKRKGIWIGGAIVSIGAVVYFFRSPAGKKTLVCACDCKEKIVESYTFIKENRNEILMQIKQTSKHMAHTVESVKEDILTITECTKDLKGHTEDFINTFNESIQSAKKILKKDDN